MKNWKYIYIKQIFYIIKCIKTYPKVYFWALNVASDRSPERYNQQNANWDTDTLSSSENALSDVPCWLGTYFSALSQGWLTARPLPFPPTSPPYIVRVWTCLHPEIPEGFRDPATSHTDPGGCLEFPHSKSLLCAGDPIKMHLCRLGGRRATNPLKAPPSLSY